MIYLYAITGRTDTLPSGGRIDGVKLDSVTVGALTAVYAVRKRTSGSGPAEWWTHECVVEALMEQATVLPARFGTTFADLASLREALGRQATSLKHRLSRVSGCVELAVRVTCQRAAAPQEPQDGRTYLLQKLASSRRREALADTTLAPLGSLSVNSRPMPGSASSSAVCISYLVPEPEVGRFSEEVMRLRRQNPQLTFSCTGPWPPYTFSTEEAA